MNSQQLLHVAPNVPRAKADLWLPALNFAMRRFLIETKEERACFIAQVLHESDYLTHMVENLNYRPQALMDKFRGRFTPKQAAEFGFVPGVKQGDQRMIASIAYANRYGNGDVHSEDGWRFRGRGPIQLTFKDNYRRCGDAIGIDLVNSPEMVEQPDAGALSAGWFWHIGNPLGHSLNGLANAGEVAAISRAINGGGNGLVERMNLSKRALEALA